MGEAVARRVVRAFALSRLLRPDFPC